MQERQARIVFLLAVAIMTVLPAHESWALVERVELVDACLYIDIAFCSYGGATGHISDLPESISGFILYNQAAQRFLTITLWVGGSVPNTIHSVFSCPGNFIGGVDGWGFLNCTFMGSFLTNMLGYGAFHAALDSTNSDTVIAVNTSVFQTILANDPNSAPIQRTKTRL